MAQSQVATIARALHALEQLAAREMTVAEVGRSFNIDRGTAARLLSTLVASGYVELANGDGRYRVAATKIITLYGLVEGRIELAQLASAILADLRDQTNETANVSVLVDDEMMYIAHQRSRASVSAAMGLGRRVAIHCSAIGKAYASLLPAERVADILTRRGQVAFTPRTIVTPSSLRAQLERVRQLGYALDDEESEFGMRCLAAPVRDYTGRVVASLGISGPSTRLTIERAHEMSVLVITAARRLSLALGWEDRVPLGEAVTMASGTSPERKSR